MNGAAAEASLAGRVGLTIYRTDITVAVPSPNVIAFRLRCPGAR